MKVLIWIGWFLIYTFVNTLIGSATGFRFGWLIFYLAWFYTSRACCRALDEKRDRKRVEREVKEANERKKAASAQAMAASGSAAATQGALSGARTVPEVKQSQRPVQRPADLPHYGMLEKQEGGHGRTLWRYRLGSYDADFIRKCAHTLLGQADYIASVRTVAGNGVEKDVLTELRRSGKLLTEHEAFQGSLKGLRLEIRKVRELTIIFTAGSDSIRVEASPMLSQEEIRLCLDQAVHMALKMPEKTAPAEVKKPSVPEKVIPERSVPEKVIPARIVPEQKTEPVAKEPLKERDSDQEFEKQMKAMQKGKRKKLIIAVVAAVLVLTVALLAPLQARRKAYDLAATYEMDGRYSEALENYTKAKKYKDAPEKVEEMERAISYQTGKQLFEAGSFAEAEQSFLQAEDFGDAAQWVETSRKAIRYEAGVKAFEARDFLLAIKEFTAAGDYSDAREQLEIAERGEHYRLGCEAYEDKDYTRAVEEFTAAGEFEDAASKLVLARQAVAYTEGVALMDKGNYGEALVKLEQAGNFTGAAERIRQCNYHLGMEALERGDDEQAYTYLDRCEGYSDSASQLAVVAVRLGKAELKAGAYTKALEYFKKARSSGSKENNLDDYIALCQAESYFLQGKLQEGVEAFQKVSSSFWPAEVNISALRNDANRLKAFADLEGSYGSNTYDIRITGGGYTHYYRKGTLKDQDLRVTCTLNADMTVTVKGTVKFYYFDSLPPLYGWGYTDKTKTLSFKLEDLKWLPSVYSIDNQTKLYFGSSPRLDYRNVVNGSSTASSVTFDDKK